MIAHPHSRRRFLAAGTALTAVAVIQAPARPAQYEFICGSIQGSKEQSSPRVAQMWSQIQRESGGRIHAQFFPDGSLGNDQSMLTQLRAGAMQFLVTTAGNLSSVMPTFDIIPLGFAYRNADEALRVMDGPLGGYLRQEAVSKGMYMMRTLYDGGMFVIGSTTHPIRTPEDLHGFKLRVTASKVTVDLFKGLGAITTPLSFNEVYPSLQTKLIDGEASPMATIEAGRFYEINRYLSLTNHAYGAVVIMVNGDTWKSLPRDLQDIVERNNTRYGMLERKDMKEQASTLAGTLAGHGMIVNTPDQTPFRANIHQYYEFWQNAFGSTAWGLLQSSLGRKLV